MAAADGRGVVALFLSDCGAYASSPHSRRKEAWLGSRPSRVRTMSMASTVPPGSRTVCGERKGGTRGQVMV